MTFSLVARCKETGMLGTAVTSSSPAVAARCSYTRSKVGAVSTQNVTDPSLGKKSLDFLEAGLTSEQVVEKIKSTNKIKHEKLRLKFITNFIDRRYFKALIYVLFLLFTNPYLTIKKISQQF